MADPADHAFAHASAILGPGEPAIEVAVSAARRGGRSRSAVLGHTRHGALARSEEACTADLDSPAPDDLTDLAVALATTRPPLERAIVDLTTRHGLDRGAFGRAIGLPPAQAAARATAVNLEWQRCLDPVVLARLGTGDCDDLAALLTAGGDQPAPVTLGALLAVGAQVAEHGSGCATCADRLRSMVSVRTLLAQRPLETAPEAVRAAAGPARLLKFPARPAPPPSLPVERGRHPRARVAGALIVLAAIAGAVIAGQRVASRERGDRARVEALTRVPLAGSALFVQPIEITGSEPAPVLLRNTSDKELRWSAEPDVPWLGVRPRTGRLKPRQSAPLRVVLGAAPEGDVHGLIRISSADGSATLVRYLTSVEHPPDVAATARGCEVTATVEDEGEVRSVTLHWVGRAGAETMVDLAADAAGFTGRLPKASESLTWWVSAVDARGNQARTTDRLLSPNSCP